MIDVLHLDTETRCEVPITHGTYAYTAACSLDLFSYSIDYRPVEVIDLQTCPDGDRSKIADIMNEARILVAHNSMFDRNVFRLGDMRLDIPIKRWRCSMVQALQHGLPGSLEKLGPILGLPEDKQKMKEGHALMLLFCKPRPKNHKLRWATAETHPEERAKYREYNRLDTEALIEVRRLLPSWNMALDFPPPGAEWLPAHTELEHYHRDQEMNDRGYCIDLDLVRGALYAVDKEQAALKKATVEATNGALSSATQRDALLDYVLAEHGVVLDDLKGGTLEKVLGDEDVPEAVKHLLRLRIQTCTTSTAKYRALQRGASADGRLRGTIQMSAAARTRRAGGRVFQPQNLPRPDMPQGQIDAGIGLLRKCPGGVPMVFEFPMKVAANAIRGAIVAATKGKLCIADYSNIEGRGLAWLAKEEWKLDAFREYDTVLGEDGAWYPLPSFARPEDIPPLALDDKGKPIRKGHDLYKLAFAKSFGMLAEAVTKQQRQVGKVQELACGYQGSLGAFISMALIYRIDLDEMAELAWPSFLPEDIERATDRIAWMRGKKIRLPILREKTLIAILCIVLAWRDAHPNVVKLWKGLEETARDAIDTPGEVLVFGRFRFLRRGPWLRIQLPSGRSLCYPQPKLDGNGFSYMGIDQYTKQWRRILTYGGKISENATQSFARDILYDAHPRIEKAGYPLVLHVHDENLTEPENDPRFNEVHLGWLMTRPPSYLNNKISYAPDLPLSAAGFSTDRYRKDD